MRYLPNKVFQKIIKKKLKKKKKRPQQNTEIADLLLAHNRHFLYCVTFMIHLEGFDMTYTPRF